jgi:(2Fe-2S) ferredoxin
MKNNHELDKRCSMFGIGTIKRHIILCGGDKCCTALDGEKTWQWLKDRTRADDSKELGIYRTKALCLRVCREGPIAVVYPEGTWYKNVTPENCQKIFEEHLVNGTVCEEIAFAKNSLK